MRIHLLFVALVATFSGCAKHEPASVVVEEHSPVVAHGVTVESLGIETLGGVFTPLIKVGVSAPCRVAEVFSTAADGQAQIMVKLYRGTNQLAGSNHSLGQYQVVGIAPAPRGTPQIEIAFEISREGEIRLFARDLARKSVLEFRRAEGGS
jgi:molecular chaperone DnaK